MPFTDINGFNAALALGTINLTLCLRLVRQDGTTLGFTRLQRPLTVPEAVITLPDGVSTVTSPETTYYPDVGMIPTNLQRTEDVSRPDNLEITGMLGSRLTEADVDNGLYDGAEWFLLTVDWSDPAKQQFTARGTVGDTSYAGPSVIFKLKSLSWALGQEILDLTSALSRAEWDDPEMAWFDQDGYTSDGYLAKVATTITSVTDDRRVFRLSATVGYPSRRFEGGLITFTDGANDGLTAEVMSFNPANGEMVLWQDTLHAMAPGDAVTARIRCPRTADEWYEYFHAESPDGTHPDYGGVLRFMGEPDLIPAEFAADTLYDPSNPGGS